MIKAKQKGNQKMKKTVAIISIKLFILIVLSSFVMVISAYWANVSINTPSPQNQDSALVIGEAGVLETTIDLSKVLSSNKKLVPQGLVAVSSGGANHNVDSIAITYTILWETSVIDPQIGTIETTITPTIIGAENYSYLINVSSTLSSPTITLNGDSVTLTITITLTNVNNVTAYQAIKDKPINIHLIIEVSL